MLFGLRHYHQLVILVLGAVALLLLVSCGAKGGEDQFFVRTLPTDRESNGAGRRRVLVGGDHNYPPFEFLNEAGTPEGFNVEILDRVASIMDMDITIELTDWSEARRRLESNELDMLAGMYRTVERAELHDFTIPFFVASYGLFVPSGSTIRGVDDLEDAVVIVHRGDLAHDYVLSEGLGREIVAVAEWPSVLAALAEGEGDCAIFGMGQGMREIRRMKYRSIRMIEAPLFRRSYGMAVQRGDAELLAMLNEGLNILKSTGEFDRTYEKWFGVLETRSWWDTRQAQTIAIVFGLGMLTAAIAVTWVAVLRQQVRRKTVQLREALAESTSARRDLEVANEAKLRFLANVSHELRTPLHGIMAMARLLDKTPLSDYQQSLMRNMDGASSQLFRVLTDLLDVSRAQAGQLTVKTAPFRVREIADWLEPTLRTIADDRNLTLRFSYDGPDVRVSGDRERIAQIVINLATNATKFTESGTITVKLTHVSDELQIVVQDSGRGMSKDELETVFEPFVQAARTQADAAGGLGLGLSIVRSLVERLSGSISVDSTVDVGTTFRVTVPLHEPTSTEREFMAQQMGDENQQEPRPATLNRDGLSILIAEDEAINRLYLRTLLHGRGATVVEAWNGVQATDLAKHQAFDVILMDINMPTVDGMEAAKRIQAQDTRAGRASPPIIALTAHAQSENAARFLGAGMVGYVSKPFDEEQVWAEIARVVEPTKSGDTSTT